MRPRLGRWDDLPRGAHHADEPPHGLMMRLATRHRNPSAARFAEGFGIEVTDVAACMGVLASYEHADRYPEQLECLRSWVPETVEPPGLPGLWRRIRGQEVRRADWSVATRRFCPACLAEAPYHRGWFDLAFMRTCPDHGLPIVDAAGEGAPAGFATASIAVTAAGDRLAHHAPRTVGRARSLEAYALARLGLREPWKHAILDRMRLGEVAAACEAVGFVILGGGGRSRRLTPEKLGRSPAEIADVGFRVLDSGRDGMTSAFKEVAREVPASVNGTAKIFGWAYNWFAPLPGTHLVRDALVDGAHALGRAGPCSSGRRRGKAEYVALGRIADKHGIDRRSVRKVAEALGVLKEGVPHGMPLVVAAGDVQKVVVGFKWGYRREDVARALQVSVKVLDRLIVDGHIASSWRGMDGDNAERFHRGNLVGFVEGIPFRHVAADDPVFDRHPAPVPLPAALERARHMDVDVILEACAGNVTPLSREAVPLALGEFLVLPDEPALLGLGLVHGVASASTRASKAPTTTMTKREACTLLGVSPRTVAALIEEGHLSTAEGVGTRERHTLDRGSVSRFGGRFLAAKYYADELGLSVSMLRRLVEDAGIVDLLRDVRTRVLEHDLAVIYEREMLTTLFGLPRDPDLELPGRLAWMRFATHLGEGRSGFMVWAIKGERKATCMRNNGSWKVGLDVGRAATSGACRVSGTLTLNDARGFDVRAAADATATKARPPGLTFQLDEGANRIEGEFSVVIPIWAADAGMVDEAKEDVAFRTLSNALTRLLAFFDKETGTGGHHQPSQEDDRSDEFVPDPSMDEDRDDTLAPSCAVEAAGIGETAKAEPTWSWADVVPSPQRAAHSRTK